MPVLAIRVRRQENREYRRRETGEGPVNARDWITAYAERLSVRAPDTEEFKIILDLAGEAAHASERVAAPVACWVAAQAGVSLEEARRIAAEISDD